MGSVTHPGRVFRRVGRGGVGGDRAGAHCSDGGGSVRIPASNSGLFGFKPTRARLPDGPCAGEGWAGMATDGFLTRSVRDQAALLVACVGPDIGAPSHAPPLGGSYLKATQTPPKPLRIALLTTSLTGAPTHPDCIQAASETASLLADMGHRIEPAAPPPADTDGMMLAWCKIVACGTALWIDSKLKALGRDWQPGDTEGIAASARAWATRISGADYLAAVGKIHAYGRQLATWFEIFDILLTPTMAEPPATIGRFTHDRDEYLDYRTGPDGVFAYSPFTAAFNAIG